MEMVLFLNANQANNGSASFKADHENKALQYFDEDGILIEESYIDSNNNMIKKKFDKDGGVISETKITEESILDAAKNTQDDHKKREVSELTSKLSILAKTAERFVKDHDGRFPQQMKDLVAASPPYLTECFCDEENPTYRIVCDINETGYKFKANSLWSHLESYIITNGEKIKILPPQRPTFENSTSTCK